MDSEVIRILSIGILTEQYAMTILELNPQDPRSRVLSLEDVKIDPDIVLAGIPTGHPKVVRSWVFSRQGLEGVSAKSYATELAVINVRSKQHAPFADYLHDNGFDVWRVPDEWCDQIFPNDKKSVALIDSKKYMTKKNNKMVFDRAIVQSINQGLNYFRLYLANDRSAVPILYMQKLEEKQGVVEDAQG
jgi:hypothetical protein